MIRMLRLKCTVVLLITLLTVLSKVKADSVETKKCKSEENSVIAFLEKSLFTFLDHSSIV